MNAEPFPAPDRHDLKAALLACVRALGDAIERDEWRRAFAFLRCAKDALRALEQASGKRTARVGGTP